MLALLAVPGWVTPLGAPGLPLELGEVGTPYRGAVPPKIDRLLKKLEKSYLNDIFARKALGMPAYKDFNIK